MKVLVIGAAGMAGHVIHKYLVKNNLDVDSLARNSEGATYSLDLEQIFCNTDTIRWSNYDYVVNAAGILNRGDNVNHTNAIFVNSFIPHFLAKLAVTFDFKFIHLSTDCVFSGKDGQYTEDAPHDGSDLYAKSKSLGEISDDNALTIRTSIVGPELKNGVGLFHWFMNQKEDVFGFEEAYWSGVTTLELSKFIYNLIQNNIKLNNVFHLTNGQPISKFELLKLIKEIYQKDDVSIKPKSSYKVDKSLVNTREYEFKLTKSYREMIEEQREWMISNPEMYKHY
jgi:dTDP-4-dehydrorhamnose reductase